MNLAETCTILDHMRKANLAVCSICAIIVTLLLSGCDRFYEAWKTATNQPKSVVIASVDGTPITDIDWDLFIHSSFLSVTSKTGIMDDRKQIMSKLIQQKLIIALAKKEGLENSPLLIRQVENYRENLLKQVYLDRLIANEPKLTEDYVKAYYILHPSQFVSNQPTWTGLRIKTRSDAQKATALLRAGKPLEEAATRYAVDKKHFVEVILDTASISDPHKVALLTSLKIGQMTPVLKTAQGYEIYRRNYPLPPPLAGIKNQVIQIIKEKQIEKKLEEAKTSIKIEISTAALMSLPLPSTQQNILPAQGIRDTLEIQKK